MQLLVLDTNIVLDLFVFEDPQALSLNAALKQGSVHWLATNAMRDEFERVLGYARIAHRIAQLGRRPANVMADFDRFVRIVSVPAKAPITCGDPDDQKFVDLAVEQKCLLLSKDTAVLQMKKRLAALNAGAAARMPAPSYMLIES